MTGKAHLRFAGRHSIGAWTSKPIQPRAQPHNFLHTLARKRVCLAPKKQISNLRYTRCSRSLFTESIPPVLLPPAIFTGLLIGLWTWKCFWIIVMQNKLLYLSWLPPFSRSDKISDYLSECKPVHWEEKRIKSLDGTNLAICEGHIPASKDKNNMSASKRRKSIVICYFQGNGGSTPLRLPLLSQVLRTLANKSKLADPNDEPHYTIVALSYRGYWTSSGSATQSGIELDARAFLNWVSSSYADPNTDLQIVLWGHSLGSAVASSVLLKHLQAQTMDETLNRGRAPVSGLILEAPISNIKDMLISLYPQKWLPYRYLWPFSWNNWCTVTSLERLAAFEAQTTEHREHSPKSVTHAVGSQSPTVPPILILSAENDEVIPPYVAGHLEKRGQEIGLNIVRKEVPGAMHTEGPLKHDGRDALVEFIRNNTP